LGSHWIYNRDEIAARFPDGIKGFETPFSGHYHDRKKSGDFTHYGDAALVVLASSALTGHFDEFDVGSRLIRLMTDDNYSGYRDHATRGMVENYRAHITSSPSALFDFQQGADDDQPATVTHLAPVVVAHLYDPDLLGTVAKATRVCQNNRRAIAYAQAAALILRALINGSSPDEAISETIRIFTSVDGEVSEVVGRIEAASASRTLSVQDATMLFGQSCPLYSSFTAALHTMLICSNNFAEALIATAQAGGDNAGRAAITGGWLGAHLGFKAIPAAWLTRLSAHDQIKTNIEKIVAALPTSHEKGDIP
jgi:ADP-ribosylglycohydrolase